MTTLCLRVMVESPKKHRIPLSRLEKSAKDENRLGDIGLATADNVLNCSLRRRWSLRQRSHTQWSGDTKGRARRKIGLHCLKSTRLAPTASANHPSTSPDTKRAPPSLFHFHTSATQKQWRNKGKFVYVDYGPGSAFNVGQRTFELKSSHLHSPSEHWIDGESFAAELHLVHEDAGGDLAVVGLLFRLGPPSPVVQAILDAAPDAGDAVAPTNDLNSGVYTPGELAYYKYDGSLTTPPCSEPVDWYVMREPKSIGEEQVDNLLALSGGPNNRPVQPKGSRKIIAGGAQ